ncbi:MAG: mechanosensitive ion channel [Phycisphaerae bacterium]
MTTRAQIATTAPTTMTQAASQPGPQPVSAGVAAINRSLDDLAAIAKEVEGAADLSESQMSETMKLLRDARGEFERARELQRRLESLAALAESGPDELRRLREQLDQTPTPRRTEITSDSPLAEAETALTVADRDLAARRAEATELDAEQKRRAERRIELPRLSAAAREQLEAVQTAQAAVPADEPAKLRQARREWFAARSRALSLELEVNDAELTQDEARSAILAARRTLKSREVAEAEKLADARRAVVEAVRLRESQRVAAEAREARRKQFAADPALAELFRRTAELAEERQKLSSQAADLARQLQALRAERDATRKELDGVNDLVNTGALSERVGQRLRTARTGLPDVRRHAAAIHERHSHLQDAKLRMLELRSDYGDPSLNDSLLNQVREKLDATLDIGRRGEIEKAAAEQLGVLATQSVELEQGYLRLLSDLSEADALERELVGLSREFADLIDAHVLWIRSLPPLGPSEPPLVAQGAAELVSARYLRELFDALWGQTRDSWGETSLGLLAVAVLFALRGRMRTQLRELAGLVAQSRSDRFRHSLQALAFTVLLAGWWPAILWCTGFQLSSPSHATPFSAATSAGLQRAAWTLLAMLVLREMAAPSGLGAAHFRWSSRNCRRLRRILIMPLVLVPPCQLMFGTTQALGASGALGSLARAAFIVAAGVLLWFAQRSLNPTTGLVEGYLRRYPGGWLSRLRVLWYPLALAIPATLIGMAALGFFFSAQHLMRLVVSTVWLLLLLLLGRALVDRWLFVARLRFDEQHHVAEAGSADEARGEAAFASDAAGAQQQTDADTLDAQARGLIVGVALLAFATGLWVIWSDLLPALRFVTDYPLTTHAVANTFAPTGTPASAPSSPVAEPPVAAGVLTVGDALIAAIIIGIVLLLAKNLPGLLELAVLRRLPLDPAARFAITTVSRYIITIVGLIAAFGQIGVGWSQVQWLAAAITFGLGFGLQDIFANFVSGLIVLFERPIRVGDVVTVGEITGSVSRIQTRSTTIVDADRRELIVPNKDLITGRVVNWTLSDTVSRQVIRATVGFNADAKLCRRLLLKAALENEFVTREPRPSALCVGIGESGLIFELQVFVASLAHGPIVRHQLTSAIVESFRQANIELSLPKRELTVRGLEAFAQQLSQSASANPRSVTGIDADRDEHA